MEDVMFIASILGPLFVVMGLSLLMYMKAWEKVVAAFQKDHYSMMPIAILNLLLGLWIVNTYSVWDSSVYVLVTFTGWAALVKGVFYMLAPGDWTKTMMKTFNMKAWFIIGGLFMVVAGGLLSHAVYWA